MLSQDRISRKQRGKLFDSKLASIALLLAVILLFLVVGNKYRSIISTLIENKIGALTLNRQFLIADSLAFSVGKNFELNRSPEIDTTLINLEGKPYRRIFQPWPSGLSLYYYAERIQAKARKFEIDCDCVDSSNFLVCRLMVGASPGAVVIVRPDKNVKFKNKAVGFIFRNIYDAESRDILKIVKKKIPFGYFASPYVYPAGEIRKKLKSPGIWSILLASSSKDDLISQGSLRQGSNKIKKSANKRPSDDDLISDLLNRHPNLRIIGFYKQNKEDRLFVKATLQHAKNLNISYLYIKSTPNFIDSLAYSAGLTFITLDTLANYNISTLTELKSIVIRDITNSNRKKILIYTVDISKVDANKFTDLALYLKNIGVNLLSIKELKNDPDFIVEDL